MVFRWLALSFDQMVERKIENNPKAKLLTSVVPRGFILDCTCAERINDYSDVRYQPTVRKASRAVLSIHHPGFAAA